VSAGAGPAAGHASERVLKVAEMTDAVVLLIEDDDVIGGNLLRALDAHFDARWVRTGADGLAAAADADLVVLDLGLPDLDGLEVCRLLHGRRPALPVIVLTAFDDQVMVVAGLEAGAVDYVTKPFHLAELVARIRAHLRSIDPTSTSVLEVGAVRVDTRSRRVTIAGDEVELRPKELDLLAVLMQSAGAVVTRDELMRRVWDEHWYGSTKTLDVHMASLRRALRRAPAPGCTITTLRGVGFRLEPA
jgi:DNA-binding response OmpR family regulator